MKARGLKKTSILFSAMAEGVTGTIGSESYLQRSQSRDAKERMVLHRLPVKKGVDLSPAHKVIILSGKRICIKQDAVTGEGYDTRDWWRNPT